MRPPQQEPWQSSRAGNIGPLVALGVGSGYRVDSKIEVLDPNFPVEPTELSGDLKGVFGGALGLEWYFVDDLSLFGGAEYRVFDPELDDDVFEFGRISELEYFLGLRYLLPVRWLPSERLRPFVQTKLAFVPSIDFDLTTHFDLPDPLSDIDLLSAFRGSSYFTLGAGGGLAYELQENLIARLGIFYEWSLADTTDVVPTERSGSTGDPTLDDFLDGVFEDLQLDVELEPRGWVAYLGFSYFL